MSVTHKFSIGNYDKDYYDNKDNYDNVVIGWRELMRLGPREDGATVYGLTLTGNGLRDYFEGDNGYDTFWGGGGDDMLQTGSGDDTLHGGDGNDLVDGARGDDYLYGDAGDDIMDGGAGDDFLYGGVGNDRMDGGADDDYLYGGDGDDMLQGSSGDDYLYGGDGDDTMDGGWGDGYLYGGDGDDTIRGDGYLYGGAGDDTLSGGPGSDKFMYPTRSFGKDVITDFDVREDKIDFRGSGLGFSDLKLGWSSPDTVLVEAGAGNRIELVALSGLGPKLENIRSAFLFDPVPQPQQVLVVVPEVSIGDVATVEGAAASLTVELSEASARDITVYFSTADGTAGSGDYSGAGQPQEITFKAGETSKVIAIDTTGDTDHEGIETFTVALSNPEGATLGSKHTATVTIVDDDDAPVDELPEDESSSTVLGEAESQSAGDNENAPPSRAAVAGTMETDTLAGASGADVIDCHGGDDTAQGLGGNDRLWGRLGADTLHGNAGNDRLWGGKGRDELHGGVGKDHLYGGRGDDVLHGGRGADRLHGDAGNDILSGGAGRDLFVYGDADFGRDRIVDFEDGTDLLKFTGSGLRWGDLSVSNNRQGHAVVRVESTDSSIVLEEVDASLIDQNDFIF